MEVICWMLAKPKLTEPAASYFVHPATSTRFDAYVKDWAASHPKNFKQLADHSRKLPLEIDSS